MSDSMKDFVSVLNGLVESCKDGQEGYQQAAEGVDDSSLKSLFTEYASQRGKFASELQQLVSSVGGDAEKSGSVGGAMHRGWINVKSAVTGKDNHAVLAECERGEDSAVKSYKEALGKNLPAEMQSVVEKQYQKVQEAHNRIKALRDSGKVNESSYSGKV